MTCIHWCFFLVAAALAAGPAAAAADEGMWLFSNPPKKELQQRYNFAPPDDWYVHLQRASVRVNSGGSGEFVSSTGLMLTNHHIGFDALEKLSTRKRTTWPTASTPAPPPKSSSVRTSSSTC